MASGTSLALRALLANLVATLDLNRPYRTISGLTPTVKALAATAAARVHGDATVLVVPTDLEVEQITNDARFFFAALEGAAPADVDAAVLPFPSLQVDPYRGMTPHFRVASVRARALEAVARGTARLIVASASALLPKVAAPARVLIASTAIRPGMEIAPEDLAVLLVDAGFTREDPVDEHGTFTVRGGILDVFPAASAEPVRIEFVGDNVETLRHFDPATQRSTGAVDQVHIVPVRERFAGDDPSDIVSLLDYVAECQPLRALVSEFALVEERVRQAREQLEASYADAAARGRVTAGPPDAGHVGWEDVAARLATAPRLEELSVDDAEPGAGKRHVPSQTVMEFHGRVHEWIADVRQSRERGDTVLFVAESAGRAERTIEILQEYGLPATAVDQGAESHGAGILVTVGRLSRGVRLPDARLQIYAETDVFDEERRAAEKRRDIAKTFLSDLRDLKVGDLVVHVDHGIGEFVGLKQLGVRGADGVSEFLELRYHGEAKLFVPVERLDLIQKYTGGSRPALDRLGGTTWEKAKTRVKKAMRDMAEELLKLYAQRRAVQGFAFDPDTHWQQEFEDAFPYELTVDQASAIADIKRDMESPLPMDRLLCGDVGYGKTEVAMRAAFKAVMGGKQVAFLAPTTILAFQHEKTLRERFAGFPATIEMVSRFRSKAEIQQTLDGLAVGRVDVIVGTHRLLSKDVRFKDLGLLVVDEEQRFGVAHKERIKKIRTKVDVLTMTATPIPRTLNMSLVGIRDMSVIETPPKDRLSIQTNVVTFDAAVIGRAIRNELVRGGQVYFVHNRVESIFSMGALLQRVVPEARITVAHGQMGEDELERAMLGFVERRFDVLLATTIVENGLDIPNANTIVINRADRYGLSQLYQLRGRVGRSDRAAFAFLLIPPQDSLSPVARKRLAAIREFSDLGSGFRVAALDLEIRGAGNLLGGQQSGHIEAVGFDMYVKLLEEAVREQKGEEVLDDTRATVNLSVDLKIADSFIPDMNQRLMVYRRVAASRSEAELTAVLDEVRDRYGPLPESVLNLAAYGRLRVLADELGVESIDREARFAVIRFRPTAPIDPERLLKVLADWPGAKLIPPTSLRLDLEVGARQPAAELPKSERPRGGQRVAPTGAARGRATGSWWTARATSGEVAAGFTKEEILRKPSGDPRAEGGVFGRVEALLRAIA
jgi:transcription-repair coupling factor (superfamily II helicase)